VVIDSALGQWSSPPATRPTAPGSHSVAFDETNKVIYMQDKKPFDGGLFAVPMPK